MTSPKWVLHATRFGEFDIYQARSTALEPPKKITTVANHAEFIKWLSNLSQDGSNQNAQILHQWRVLADMTDPITCCISVPKLNRRDRQDFLSHRLNTHHPSAPWRYSDFHHDQALLVALPDSHKPESQLKPLLEALIAAGHVIDVLVTPGQLFSHLSNQKAPELIVSQGPQGTLVALFSDRKFRFSRWIQQTIAPELLPSHLLPTLLTHHLIARNQMLQVHVLTGEIYPQQQISHLAYARLLDIPRQIKGAGLGHSEKLKQKIRRIGPQITMGVLLIVALACLSYGWIALQQANQIESSQLDLQDIQSTASSSSVPATWPALEAYRKQHTCPDLFQAIQALSETLNSHPVIQINRIRWECLHANEPAKVTLNIEISEPLAGSDVAPYLELQTLLNDLQKLGQTDVKPQAVANEFVIQLHIPVQITLDVGNSFEQSTTK